MQATQLIIKKIRLHPIESLLVLIVFILILGFWGNDINRWWLVNMPQLESKPEKKERLTQVQNSAYTAWLNEIHNTCGEKSRKGVWKFVDIEEVWKCRDAEEERLKSDPNTPSKTVQQAESYMGLSDKKWVKVFDNYLFELPF